MDNKAYSKISRLLSSLRMDIGCPFSPWKVVGGCCTQSSEFSTFFPLEIMYCCFYYAVTVLYMLCLHPPIPPPRDTSVTTRHGTNHFLAKTQFTHEKVLFTHKLWPTPLPTNTVTPCRLYTSLPARMYIYAHCLFCLLFLSIIYPALGPQGCY